MTYGSLLYVELLFFSQQIKTSKVWAIDKQTVNDKVVCETKCHCSIQWLRVVYGTYILRYTTVWRGPIFENS